MSKGNMLLGYARGKVGSLVFSRRKGEQVTRARNTHPTNPRTPLQLRQRMRMYAPVQFYKASIATQFKYAFEDQRTGETAFNAFMRHNINLAPWTSRTLANEYAPIPFPAIMSQGSTPNCNWGIGQVTGDDGVLNAGTAVYLNFGVNSTMDNLTVDEFTANVLRDNPQLKEGDMLTFVAVGSTGLAIDGSDVIYSGLGGFQFRHAQVVLSLTDETLLDDLGLQPMWIGDKEANPKLIGLPFASGADWTSDLVSLGGCVIVSRKVNGKVIASHSVLSLSEGAMAFYNHMTTDSYRRVAELTYGVGQEALLDPAKEG